MSDIREQAVLTLYNTLKNKEFFSSTEDAFSNMLILTALRHLTFIKKTLRTFTTKKLPDKVIIAEYALILGATELLYMNSPDYAVINSYVNIVKKLTDQYVANFTNAVLRNIAKHKEEIQKSDTEQFFPPEFLKILKSDYDAKTIQQIEKACVQEPPLDVTIKTGSTSNIDGVKLDEQTIRIFDKVKVTKLDGFSEGLWWVQDYAASLAVKTLGDIKGKTALDICAAPGGKTAQLIDRGAIVTAVDISETRLKTLEENLERLKMKAAEIICADGFDFLRKTDKKFDIILLDAPCSATGTIRRHPEIVHSKNIKDVEAQTKIQRDLLNLAAKSLSPDGILLYCTCSISKKEGEQQIKNFLGEHKEFKLIEEIRTLPHQIEGGQDSFYIAKLTCI